MSSHRQPQTVHREHTTILVTEQIVLRFSATNGHILPEDGNHLRAERNGLNFAVLIMPKNDLPCIKVYIPVLDIADGGRAAAAVH